MMDNSADHFHHNSQPCTHGGVVNFAALTLSALEGAPTTDELIQEVSKRVYIAQGNSCKHDNVHEDDEQVSYIDPDTGETEWPREIQIIDVCDDCGERGVHIPAITNPSVFWPLAWEHNIIPIKMRGSHGYMDNPMVHNLVKLCWDTKEYPMLNIVLVRDDNPGVYIGLEFLKIKQQEMGGQFDTAQEAIKSARVPSINMELKSGGFHDE